MTKNPVNWACADEFPPFTYSLMRYFALFLILFSSLQTTGAAMNPKMLYTVNCSACHQLKIQQGGPPLTEISKLYRGKQDVFVKWAKNPTPHKRKNLAQMPAMAHIPEADLKKIYDYMMAISKDVKPLLKKEGDRFPEQLDRRPMVQRIFLEETGPASIAVALNNEFSFAFDAGESRLRYLWKGGFLNGYPYWKGNGNALAKRKGKILFTEERSPLPFHQNGKRKFLGYSMKDGLPTFRYLIDDIKVSERITPTKRGIRRVFTLKNAPPEITLTFPMTEGTSYQSPSGRWNGTQLKAKTEAPIEINYFFFELK